MTVVAIDLVVALGLVSVLVAMWFLPVWSMRPVQIGVFGLSYLAGLIQASIKPAS